MDSGKSDILKKPVRYLKGVGESRALLFAKLGVFTVEDLLTYFPREYEDRSIVKKIAEIEDDEICSFVGVIMSPVTESRPRRGLSIQKAYVKDDTGVIVTTWFNQSYLKKTIKTGDKYVFYGRISKKYRSFEVLNPVYEKIDGKELKNACRIVPVYPSTSKLTQNVIRSAIRCALDETIGSLEEVLPLWLKRKYFLSEINYSIKNIHFPEDDEDFINARRRLVFEELLLLQLGLFSIKASLSGDKRGVAYGKVHEMDDFIEKLPFKLTNAQKKVFEEISKDMESSSIMNRLIQGDVGSGKTIVAVLALFKAVKNEYQGAFMVPTEILAEQHYRVLSSLFAKWDIDVSLLTGGLTRKQKEEVRNSIKEGKTCIVIGTHALIEDSVEFKRLGLVVTDEQHRFGVRQRAALLQKGLAPDVLVMTATPIPRTLALILYGDLDISVIDELPPGRKPVETYVVEESMRKRINNFIRKKVAEGRQVYIVCPLVEESDSIEAKSAVELAERIAKVDFIDLKVGLIHGKMKPKEKDDIMKGFVKGDIDILVSTTVIEVGVNVPNATMMVVENAERFGLAQLHQLRGRVGRGEHQSYCILYSQSNTHVAEERMRVMEKTNNGFIISEKDLELRGSGEFFGTRQHGLPDLKVANLYKDIDVLKETQEAAHEVLERDRLLLNEEHFQLRKRIFEKFKDKLKDLSLN